MLKPRISQLLCPACGRLLVWKIRNIHPSRGTGELILLHCPNSLASLRCYSAGARYSATDEAALKKALIEEYRNRSWNFPTQAYFNSHA